MNLVAVVVSFDCIYVSEVTIENLMISYYAQPMVVGIYHIRWRMNTVV